ncbi:hypothetical protein [Stigmatella erecta]|uniref:Uncharacterized protein n=1 Tax=Stigmatella erecta TaxID=83460 RepID=A0A1I0JVF3_9BACT|nr:hypothetical protein [Stigmatella erecta]SEU14127.1 hypothetical protein SAMN05443639_108105 [Stigmatella erecta]
MGWKGWRWGTVLATMLCVQAMGCSSDEPAPEGPPDAEEAPSAPPTPPQAQPPVPEEQTPPAPQEPSPEPPEDPAPAPACEGLLPEQLGPSRSIVLKANGPSADCGPGAGDGAGFLALMNSGPFGATAWDMVSGEGVPTGKRVYGGDSTNSTMPQPQGFHVVTSSPGGATLHAYSSEGGGLNSQGLTDSQGEPYSVAADPQGGALAAVWKTSESGISQVLTYQFLDAAAVPLGEPTEVARGPLAANRFVVAGVDTQGRALLLWSSAGANTWTGQWLSRQGGLLGQPFTFPAPAVSAPFWRLYPLAGGGLALQGDAQWVAWFPSGEAEAPQPAPAWLASHPGSQLALIRNQQANVLIRMPTMSGAGCQESLLVFASDGTACGELLFPPDGSTCFQRQLGVGLDGTVIQQVDRSAQATPQCSWRWWPGLLR